LTVFQKKIWSEILGQATLGECSPHMDMWTVLKTKLDSRTFKATYARKLATTNIVSRRIAICNCNCNMKKEIKPPKFVHNCNCNMKKETKPPKWGGKL
jgi:hypothetical protein